MKRLSRYARALLWILFLLSGSCLFASEAVEAEEEEASDASSVPAEAAAPPAKQAAENPMLNPFGGFWTRLAPRHILAGPQAGLSYTSFRTSPEYGALLKPTPSNPGPNWNTTSGPCCWEWDGRAVGSAPKRRPAPIRPSWIMRKWNGPWMAKLIPIAPRC